MALSGPVCRAYIVSALDWPYKPRIFKKWAFPTTLKPMLDDYYQSSAKAAIWKKAYQEKFWSFLLHTFFYYKLKDSENSIICVDVKLLKKGCRKGTIFIRIILTIRSSSPIDWTVVTHNERSKLMCFLHCDPRVLNNCLILAGNVQVYKTFPLTCLIYITLHFDHKSSGICHHECVLGTPRCTWLSKWDVLRDVLFNRIWIERHYAFIF